MHEEFEKFGFFLAFLVFALVAMAAYPAFRLVIKILLKRYNQLNRPRWKPTTAVAPKPVYERKTDIYEKLTPDQKKIHEQAVQFLREKQIIQAARLFDSINFQRRAVDELENAALIDEACAILLRINAIQRAAVVYERNGHLEKAAKIYMQAQQFDKAAKNYETMSQKRFQFLEQAASCYGKAGDLKSQVSSLALLGQIVSIVEVCRQNNRYDLLISSLGNSIFFESALENLTPQDMKRVVEDLPLNPLSIGNLCLWLSLSPPSFVSMKMIFERLNGHPDLLIFLWQVLFEKVEIVRLAAQDWDDATEFVVQAKKFFTGHSGKEALYLQKLQNTLTHSLRNPSDYESEEIVVFDLKLAS